MDPLSQKRLAWNGSWRLLTPCIWHALINYLYSYLLILVVILEKVSEKQGEKWAFRGVIEVDGVS